MKFLVVIACALAVASAEHVVAPWGAVYGAQHLPVIGANGVPVDTAEVQHARAAHLAHKVEAHARNGDYAYAHAPVVAAAYAHAPVVSAYAHHAAPVVAAHGVYAHGVYAHAPAAYPTTAVLPASVNGVPLETPEVVAAKSHHFAAHAEALARTGHHAVLYRARRGIVAAPAVYSTLAAPVHYGAQHLPIIGANGVPVDTAEVQHARAAHYVHKAEAHARNGDYAYSPIVATGYAHAPVVASTYAHAPVVAATYGAHAYGAHAYGAHAYSYAAPWARYY